MMIIMNVNIQRRVPCGSEDHWSIRVVLNSFKGAEVFITETKQTHENNYKYMIH